MYLSSSEKGLLRLHNTRFKDKIGLGTGHQICGFTMYSMCNALPVGGGEGPDDGLLHVGPGDPVPAPPTEQLDTISAVDPDPNWIRFQEIFRIRIQTGKKI